MNEEDMGPTYCWGSIGALISEAAVSRCVSFI
jgi:hypothetical protein